MKSLITRASGKLILCGEHSAVYGAPALAVGVEQAFIEAVCVFKEGSPEFPQWHLQFKNDEIKLTDTQLAQLDEAWLCAQKITGLKRSYPHSIYLRSTIPVGAGMGSSAALSLAMIRLCYLILEQEVSYSQQVEDANQIDQLFHGTASGLDVSACAAENKVIRFKKGEPTEFIKVASPLKLIVIDSGERSSTSKMVAQVKKFKETSPERFAQVMDQLIDCSAHVETYLSNGHLGALGETFDVAQKALNELGVVTPHCAQLCAQLKEQGALGAKITGAGGGGCVMGVFDQNFVLPSDFHKDSTFECVLR